METKVWFKVISESNPESQWTKVRVGNSYDVDDLKDAIIAKDSYLKDYSSGYLIIKAKHHKDEDDAKAVVLDEMTPLTLVFEQFAITHPFPAQQTAAAQSIWLLVFLPFAPPAAAAASLPRKFTAEEFLSSDLPRVSHLGYSRSVTKPTHGLLPQKVVLWNDFTEDARRFVPEKILLNAPVFLRDQTASNEAEVGMLFSANAMINVASYFRGLSLGAPLAFRAQAAIMGGSIPDQSAWHNDETILVCEVKTKDNIDCDNLAQKYLEDLQNDIENPTSSVVKAVKQVFGSLAECGLQFGALTTYEHTWYLRRPDDDPGCLMISSCVEYSSTSPSIMWSLAYVLNLALGNPHAPSPPPSPVLDVNHDRIEEGDRSAHDSEDDDCNDKPYRPSKNFSSLFSRRPITRGSANPQQFNWNSYSLINMLGSGRNGTVFEGYFQNERVAIKICDIIHKPAYEKEMLTEVKVYWSLSRLQGNVVPELKAFGYTPSGLFALVMQLAGFPINPKSMTDEERNIAVKGLESFHRSGYLHGDLRPDNILIQYHSDGPKIMLIDFTFSKEITNPREVIMEQGILKKIIRYPHV